MKEVDNGLTSFKKKAMLATGVIGGLAAGLVLASVKLSKFGMDAEETKNKFEAVFKDMSQKTEQWARDFGRQYGFARTQMLGFLATVQDTLVPMGMARDKAAGMSTEIVSLAADLGSFNNIDTSLVIRDIQSALVGNTETMRKYGVVITETRMKQYALTNGIIKEGQQLDELQKMRVRYLLMLNDTTDAQGDLARTADSSANQYRKMKNLIRDIADKLGLTLLPVVNKVLTGFNSVLSVVSNVIDKFTTQKKSIEDLVKEYEELKTKEELTADEKERLRKVTDELTKSFPDSIIGIDKETGAWEVNTDSILENVRTRKLLDSEAKFKDRIKSIEQETEKLKEQNKELLQRNELLTPEEEQMLGRAKMKLLSILAEQDFNLEELFGKNNFNDISFSDFFNLNDNDEVQNALKKAGLEVQTIYRENLGILKSYDDNINKRNQQILENEKHIAEITGEADKLAQTLSDIDKVFAGEMSLEEFFKKAAEEAMKLNTVLEDPNIDPNAARTEKLELALAEQYKRQMEEMAMGRIQLGEAVNQAIIENIEEEEEREKKRLELLAEQRKRYEMGRVKAVEEAQKILEAEEQEYIDTQINRWSQYQDQITKKTLEAKLKEKQLLDNYKKWQLESNEISKQEYLDYLKDKLTAVEKWSNDYITILKQIKDIEAGIVDDSKTQWQDFLEKLFNEAQDHPIIQLFNNLGFQNTKLGQLFSKAGDKLGEMVGGFFEDAFGEKWGGVIFDIIKQTESFQMAMKVLNAFLKPFIDLVDMILMPLLKFIARLWNAIIDGLAGISIFGWKPFAGLKKYKIDLEDDKDPEEEKTTVNGTQIANLTGQDRNMFADLLRPLRSLTSMNVYLDSINRNVANIAAMMGAGNLSPAVAGDSGISGEKWVIQQMTNNLTVPNKSTADNLLKELGFIAAQTTWKRGED